MEVPVKANFVEGRPVDRGAVDQIRAEAMPLYRPATGISYAEFNENLTLVETGTDFSGVLRGRATWKEGITIYGS